MMQSRRILLFVTLCVSTTAAVTRAVIVGPGNGSQNTSQGTMPDGWKYTGTIRSGSAVYLGNGWGITARHLGTVVVGNTLTIPSGSFTVDQPSVRLNNGSGIGIDLQMFHLGISPLLPALNIPIVSPSAGTQIFVVGTGRSAREANPTYWDVTGSGSGTIWTPSADPSLADAGGFVFGTSRAKRWGTNLTRTDPDGGNLLTADVDAGFGPTNVFFSDFYTDKDDFTKGGGTASEMQLSSGDSGGGVFDANNQLLGISVYTSGFANQPANTAVFGSFSYFANLAPYRDQITTIVPEPAVGVTTVVLTLVVAGRQFGRGRKKPIVDCMTRD